MVQFKLGVIQPPNSLPSSTNGPKAYPTSTQKLVSRKGEKQEKGKERKKDTGRRNEKQNGKLGKLSNICNILMVFIKWIQNICCGLRKIHKEFRFREFLGLVYKC